MGLSEELSTAATAPVPSAPAVSSSADDDFVDDLRDVFRILYDDDDESEDGSEDGRPGEGKDAEADKVRKLLRWWSKAQADLQLPLGVIDRQTSADA